MNCGSGLHILTELVHIHIKIVIEIFIHILILILILILIQTFSHLIPIDSG